MGAVARAGRVLVAAAVVAGLGWVVWTHQHALRPGGALALAALATAVVVAPIALCVAGWVDSATRRLPRDTPAEPGTPPPDRVQVVRAVYGPRATEAAELLEMHAAAARLGHEAAMRHVEHQLRALTGRPGHAVTTEEVA